MMRWLILIFVFVIVGSAFSFDYDQHDQNETTRYSICNPDAGSVYQYSVETLDGKNESMQRYAGNVLMIVNVATFCRFTEQYLELNPMAKRHSDQDMQIAAFPCNQFNLQEPGHNDEILNGLKYVRPGNGFEPADNMHIYGKLEVNGKNAHPLYKFLKKSCPPTGKIIGETKYLFWDEISTNDITWNFEKFIIDRQGRPRYRFHPAAWEGGKNVEKYLQEILSEGKDASSSIDPSKQKHKSAPRPIVHSTSK